MKFKEYLKLLLESMSFSQAKNIFGIESPKSSDEIKKIYRKLALKAHPDKGGSEEKMKKINAAYEILKQHSSELNKSNNTSWDNIHQKYKKKAEEINKTLEKTFKPKIYEQYLNKTIGYNFKNTKIDYYGEEYYKSNIYGSPSYAGLKAVFEDINNDAVIEIDFLIYLPNTFNSKGLADSGSKYPLDVSSTGFIAGRKFKLFNSSWKRIGITDDKINNPETILPVSKLKKQLTKKSRTKVTKKDFVSYITKILKGDTLNDDYWVVELSDGLYLSIIRGVMMRKGYYRFKILNKTGKYRYDTYEDLLSYAPETPELFELLQQIKGKSSKQLISLFKNYKKQQNL